MWRDFVSLISILCGVVFGCYAAITAFSTIFGLDGVSRRGTQLDADWATTGLLALSALFFVGLYWLVNWKRPKGE